MPRPRSPLPPLPPSFRVRDALTAGVSRGVLRHSRFTATFHGTRARTREATSGTTSATHVLLVAKAYLPRLRPGEAVSHTSALLLHGCPIHVAPKLHVTCQTGHAPARARDVVGHQSSASPALILVDTVPVLTPEAALVQCAGSMPLRELVVAIDHFLSVQRSARENLYIDRDALRRTSEDYRGRGALNLRLAVSLSASGADSRMETLTRLLLVAFGLDESFELQSAVYDEGGWVGRFDFVDHTRKVIVEYDGDQHRTDRAQYEKDMRRLDRARAAGYQVIQLRSGDVLRRPVQTAARIGTALGATLRPHPRSESLLEL